MGPPTGSATAVHANNSTPKNANNTSHRVSHATPLDQRTLQDELEKKTKLIRIMQDGLKEAGRKIEKLKEDNKKLSSEKRQVDNRNSELESELKKEKEKSSSLHMILHAFGTPEQRSALEVFERGAARLNVETRNNETQFPEILDIDLDDDDP